MSRRMAFLHLPPIRWLTSFYNPPNKEGQKIAYIKYKAKQPGKAKVYQTRSYARRFIRGFASGEDLDELESLIKERRQKLKQGQD